MGALMQNFLISFFFLRTVKMVLLVIFRTFALSSLVVTVDRIHKNFTNQILKQNTKVIIKTISKSLGLVNSQWLVLAYRVPQSVLSRCK